MPGKTGYTQLFSFLHLLCSQAALEGFLPRNTIVTILVKIFSDLHGLYNVLSLPFVP